MTTDKEIVELVDKTSYPITIAGFQTEGQCREKSFYIRFNDEDIEELAQYAFEMGYILEPVLMTVDPQNPISFKIISKANPAIYGWISKVVENTNNQWQDAFIYGFYRHGRFICKYPITFNIQSSLMHGAIMRNTTRNPRQSIYFRTVFGIIDLEPQINPLEFVLSWLYGCNIIDYGR